MKTNKRTNERTNERKPRAMPRVNGQSGIAKAIEELSLERQNLAVRVEKLDALIASMRDVFHLPWPLKIKRAPSRRSASASVNSSGRALRPELDDAIQAALKAGPVAPGELAAALDVDRAKLRYAIKQLEGARPRRVDRHDGQPTRAARPVPCRGRGEGGALTCA